ncbi:glycerol-3-phosphate 1-O-acyltransferase PlsY [Formicincola oecophyllae]|uniref:Glycerol-3-phosphate acyltransferase n=1 Tax=Formicincola oecophyllae TaxID=2558361 RepID=A0A4Y6UB75_9PROT|nr:glycerol-3-phosphate 1-O-acyltransferase PlsY [Formicincola oecophyllae]QDH13717.1 glycerol-3-phosphate 1-O-acyltransferase PlsY [Formicincola oecophyllae]
MMGPLLLAGALGYLLGSVPFGLLLVRLSGGGDIRAIGSGNIGATNVLRTGKKSIAAATLLLDALKGLVAVLLGGWLGQASGVAPLAASVAAVCVVLGHCFPLWLSFKGGKGVATGLGALVGLCWPVGLACALLWLGAARASRISSVGALTAFLAAPLLMAIVWLWSHDATPAPVVATLAVTLIVMLRHHANIKRLVAGVEPRVGQK